MKFNIIFVFIISLGFFVGCKDAGTTGSDQGTAKTTASGHAYTQLKAGSGDAGAAGDVIVFHMAQLVDDSLLMDSRTFGRPQSYPIPEPGSRPMQPIEEILVSLVPGDSVRISMKMDTMSQKPPGVSGEFFHIDLTVVEVKSMKEAKAKEAEVAAATNALIAEYNENKLGDKLQTDPSGLKYVIHEQGSGAKPQNGQKVEVNYYGALTDGSMFDNSFGRGESFMFPLGAGQVIKGWDLGIPLINEGGKATLFIPYELGYGEAGSPPRIPGKSELVFYVELIKAQ